MKPVLDAVDGPTCVNDDGGSDCCVAVVAVEVDATTERSLTSCRAAGKVLRDPSMHSKGIDLDESDCLINVRK
jgi:hypothetical protein